jgi:hypothetical protein
MKTTHTSAVRSLLPPRDLIRVGSRRWFLQTGLAGFAGLTLADTLRAKTPSAPTSKKAVILFWLSGGPSQIDTWDPKPDAPSEIRGPYKATATSVPGIRFCEHLPLQAKLAHKLTVIRSVDCSASNHTPITMQAGHPLARRTDDGKDGGGYPSMGSIAAKFRGPNAPAMPAFVGLADKWKSDVHGAGHMGHAYEPVKGDELPGRLAMPEGVNVAHVQDRATLRKQFEQLSRDLDTGHQMAAMDDFTEKAMDMVVSPKVRDAFDLSKEPEKMRDAYGRVSVGEKALLARRLVEAGSTFVLVSGKWGYFDHHGDDVPPWGGIQTGLTPILPTIDRTLSTLIEDLDARGLLESTLVLMLGEFGRSPRMTKGAGRDHWTSVMSMLAAGGSGSHGRVIGSTDSNGGTIKSGKVGPADLAATVFRHLDIPLNAQWVNPQGRPIPVVADAGTPIPELV